MNTTSGKLTPKQTAFVQEYLIDLNATAAAKRAGYAPAYADRQAHQLLVNPRVAVALEAAKAARSQRTEITADRVVKELAKVGFSNLLDFFRITSDGEPYIDLSDITRDQAAVLAELVVEDFVDGRGDDTRDVKRVRVKLHDKLKALEQLAKHLGIADKLDVTSGGEKLQGAVVHVYLPDNGRGSE